MVNLTKLEINTLMGFEHEDTHNLYLRGSQRNELKSFECACKWQNYLRPFFQFVIKTKLYPENIVNELIDFARERHFRSFFPNQ